MKRGLWILAGAAAAALGWACWPGEEADPSAADPAAEAGRPGQSLAEQLELAEREQDGSKAERGRVTGRVEDEAGQPISGAEVRAFEAGGQGLDAASCPVCSLPILECGDLGTARELLQTIREGKGKPRQLAITTSGPDGTFQLEDLPEQELALSAGEGGRVGRAIYFPGDEAVVTLSPPAKLLLRVLREEAEEGKEQLPLPGTRVSAFSLDTFQLIETATDGAGQVHLDGLDEGAGVRVLLEAPGLVPQLATVYSDQDLTELALWPGRSLLVRTTLAGTPAEAKVTVVSASTQHPLVQQTQSGRTRFDGLGEDAYQVTAATESMVAPIRAVSLDEELTTVDLELLAAAKLLVTVIDEAGDPVAEAEVTITARSGDYYSALASNGALAVLGPLGEGPVTVEVNTPDFIPWQRGLDLHPGDNPLEVVVKRGVKLRGTVVDAEGKPVVQAQVHAPGASRSSAVATTDLDGSFELTFEEPGAQELTASLRAVGRTTLRVVAPADGVVIRLEPGGRLRVLVHEGRTPIPGASVVLTREDENLEATSGEDGWAVIAGLATDSYALTVQSHQFRQPPPIPLSLTEGRTSSIEVALDRGLRLSGVVVDSRGAPVGGAAVSTAPWVRSAVTDGQGRFSLSTLDPAVAYRVEAETELLSSAPLVIQGEQPPLRLVLGPRPMVSGRVVDGVTGAPVTRFEVDSTLVEDPDGRFSVPLNQGEDDGVMVAFTADGYEIAIWEGTREASRELGTVRLQKARQIEGVVRDGRGNPVPGALVSTDYTSDEVTSGADGSFRLSLTGYQPGISLYAERGQLKGSAVLQLVRVTEILLNPPTRVLGQVVDANGRPVAGLVTLRDVDGADDLEVDAAADGSFAIDVAQGRWVFFTRASASGQTVLVSGASMRVVLGTPPGSCAISIQAPSVDGLILLPAGSTPGPEVPFEQLASTAGAVLFEPLEGPRTVRAAGFRCGSYTLVARWGGQQRLQPLELRSGDPAHLQLAPPGLAASAP